MHDADDTPSCGQKGQEHGHGHGVADAVGPETRNGNAQQEQLERSLQVRATCIPRRGYNCVRLLFAVHYGRFSHFT